ncbi:hypothetical protein [Chryseobacterium sp. Leaf394]|uniref:hypothetical protein n=1 Tax=Chryseobacterium sp. Leaf394 TaxID=1736361 RepID=UPI000FF8AFB0|nr:hypothetical protein [Chryseobacterium sp. Leaf394]
MRKILFFLNTTAKNIKFSEFSRVLRAFFCTILFISFSFLHSQQSSDKAASPTIVTVRGAGIYSEDAGFNKQIISENVTVKNSDYSYSISKSGKRYLQITAQQSFKRKQNQNQDVRIAKKGKEKPTREHKKLTNLKKTAKGLRIIHLYHLPVQERFFPSDPFSANYTVPSQNSIDQFKLEMPEEQKLVKKSLDHLHSQKYRYYNSRSFDFCFSTVYSVRPPPSVSLF